MRSKSNSTSAPEASESNQASRSICVREAAANTPGPLTSTFNFGSTAWCTAPIACSCASASKPPATVSATSSARRPSPVNQTPPRLAGEAAGRRSKMRRSSPVGSRGSIGAQRAGRLRRELGERGFQRRAQRGRAEALAARRWAEHVTVVHEGFAIGAQAFVAAVLHRREQFARAQLRSQRAARLCQPLVVCTAYRDQQDARRYAAAHLIEQELLRGRRRGRQEGTQVGDHAGVRELPAGQREEAAAKARPRGAAAYFPSCTMVMTERSPVLSSTSMRCGRAAAPETVIDSTCARTWVVRGTRCRRQASRRPENCTR
jgi:hypothetical protein